MLTFAIVAILVVLAKEVTLGLAAAAKCPGDMIYDKLKAGCVCPRDMYYDGITRCTGCYNICNNAALQGTKDECDSLCPDYQLPLSDMPASSEREVAEICPKDMYYDGVTRRCSNCFDICYHAAIQRTEDECNAACPDYHLPFTTTISPVPGPDYHKVVVIISICSSVVLFIGIAIAVCCYRAKCKRKGREMCSLVVSLLPCVPRDGNGAEAENDMHHEMVQLAISRRQSEVFDNQQPNEPEANAKLLPSCLTANNINEETKLKVGH